MVHQVHRCVETFCFCFERISRNKNLLFKPGETFIICFRARLKKGGVEGDPSCFFARVTHPETWFLPPFFLYLKQRIPSGKGCFFFLSLQTPSESSELPNPPVVQKRDPRTFPRFALKKRVGVPATFHFDFCFRTAFFMFRI
jgi:hypothetical protein